jgi:uncharacterized protein YndB with AHSA1/START domain
MNFTSKQDIDAPTEHVFRQLSDFDFFESYAMRLGAQVERMDLFTQPQPGMCWNIKGHYRGKDRDLELTLDSYYPPDTLSYLCATKNLNANIGFDIIPLSRRESRLKVSVDIIAKGISARVALQSAKLAKKSLDRKFDARVRSFAAAIGDKYNG